MRGLLFAAGVVALGPFATHLSATPVVTMTPSLSSPQPLGTPITWTVTASDTSAGLLTYRFSTGPAGSSATFAINRDYAQASSFQWTPSTQEGAYQVKVDVRNNTTLSVTSVTAQFSATSLVIGTTPVISNTANPLVALYSAPTCPTGSAIRVRFARVGAKFSVLTNTKACPTGGQSVNFYIGGMRAVTQYSMRYEVITGGVATPGPAMTYTTGALAVTFPTETTTIAAQTNTDLTESVILHSYLTLGPVSPTNPIVFPAAIDLTTAPIWYYAGVANDPTQTGALAPRAVSGGTFLMIMNGPNSVSSVTSQQILREIDMAGNAIRETNVGRISEQLAAQGKSPTGAFHHEAARLPNGYTLVHGTTEKNYPCCGIQGSTNPAGVDILGDYILVLDQNFQLTWSWNSFDHLDVNRTAILGEVCNGPSGGCPPLLIPIGGAANDWLHSNSSQYQAGDGSIVTSIRHQDWVIKIDYNNGFGTGNVLWKMGNAGDFTVSGSDPYPWFTHQHDAGFELGANTLMTVWDNGNTRVAQNPGVTEHSRGMVLTVNEAARTVSPVYYDSGVYAFAVGSAQRLANGNFHFQPGIGGPPPVAFDSDIEFTPAGPISYQLTAAASSYRSFRMKDLYTAAP